jgi:adenylate kinase
MLRSGIYLNRFNLSNSQQTIFFLFGAPGVGKGTYAKMLQNDLGLLHLSTGDEIRKILRGNSSKGLEPFLVERLRKIVRTGGLISDDVVF